MFLEIQKLESVAREFAFVLRACFNLQTRTTLERATLSATQNGNRTHVAKVGRRCYFYAMPAVLPKAKHEIGL